MRGLKNTYQLWWTMIIFIFLLTLIIGYFIIQYTWEIGVNWGSFEEHMQVWKLIAQDTVNFSLNAYFQYENFIIENNLLLDLALHIGIPLCLSLIMSSFIIINWLWVKGGIDKAVHISGAKLYKHKFAIRHAIKALKKEIKNKSRIGINLHPAISISEIQEVGNILVEGAQGSGKSTVIKPIVKEIMSRRGRMLIYDAKKEYTQLFYKPGHLLLSPTDKRSLCWDIASDVTSPEIAYEVACCFISQSDKEPIWANGARLILTGCMVSLIHTQPNWSWLELKVLLDKPTSELKSLFEQYYPKAAKLISENSKTTDSFIMELTTQLSWIDYLSQVWTKENRMKFSVIKWIEGDYDLQSLIIPNDPKYSSISAPLCSAVLSIVVREILILADDDKRKFWFVLDELADLPKTKALEKWLALGRSKGARTIAGTQNISQIQAIYGDKNTETITSLFSNIITLKIGSSSVTAKKVADNLGKRIVKRATINFDKEGKRSTSYQQSEEYIVRPEQLMQIPISNKKGISGYLSISGWNAVYELIWPYPRLKKIAEAHIPVQLKYQSDESGTHQSKRGRRGRNRLC